MELTLNVGDLSLELVHRGARITFITTADDLCDAMSGNQIDDLLDYIGRETAIEYWGIEEAE